MYVNKCIKCGAEFETKNPKRVICPSCLYADKGDSQEEKPMQSYSSYSSYSAEQQRPRSYDRPQQGGYRNNSYNRDSQGYNRDRSQGGYQRRDNQGGGYNRDNRAGGYNRRPEGNRDNRGGGYRNNYAWLVIIIIWKWYTIFYGASNNSSTYYKRDCIY